MNNNLIFQNFFENWKNNWFIIMQKKKAKFDPNTIFNDKSLLAE